MLEFVSELFIESNTKREMKRLMKFLTLLFYYFGSASHIKNCPKHHPFAVSGGKRCMKIFEVYSNSTEQPYKNGSKNEWLIINHYGNGITLLVIRELSKMQVVISQDVLVFI